MERLTICETDRGRYAVRPMSWAGIWNEKGQIKEALNHLALFVEKEDAEKFVEWKEEEEQGKLLKLPCAVGDTVYVVMPYTGRVKEEVITGVSIKSNVIFMMCDDEYGYSENVFGKTVFLTKSAAEQALKEMGEKK